jgi:hypothetical protein
VVSFVTWRRGRAPLQRGLVYGYEFGFVATVLAIVPNQNQYHRQVSFPGTLALNIIASHYDNTTDVFTISAMRVTK